MAKRNLNVWGMGVLTLLLVAGSAFAAQTESISLPVGQKIMVNAVLVPGANGGECVIGWADEEDLRIPVGPSSHLLLVTIDIRQMQGGWYASYTVRDLDAGGSLVAQESGIELGGEPTTAQATGDSVISLTAE